MALYQEYVVPASLEEAWTLNQKKSAVVVAGNMWLRMCGMRRKTAIDLSALGLDGIEDCGDHFEIGAMTTLRELETSAALSGAFGTAFADALSPIVGTQFRNTATVGGSVFSRFGFSDVNALLLAMGASVRLWRRGEVSLRDFQREAPDRDILTHILLPKGLRAGVASVRLNATDFPVLVAAACAEAGKARVVLGARPARSQIVFEGAETALTPDALEEIAKATVFGSNLRASAAYRERIAPVLMRRALEACMKEERA